MADASCMAGMAFANAFLGVCHSMAHKLGAYHHLPHGIANALLICHVMRFNAAEVPAKMGTFSQYQYPHTLGALRRVRTLLRPLRQGTTQRHWSSSSRRSSSSKRRSASKRPSRITA